MDLYRLHRPVAVEQLVFRMDEKLIERWIELDAKIWTEFLCTCRGYVKKEIWQSPDAPAEVTSMVYWDSYDDWKAIDPTKLGEVCSQFDSAFAQPYELCSELHLLKQMYITYTDRKRDLV